MTELFHRTINHLEEENLTLVDGLRYEPSSAEEDAELQAIFGESSDDDTPKCTEDPSLMSRPPTNAESNDASKDTQAELVSIIPTTDQNPPADSMADKKAILENITQPQSDVETTEPKESRNPAQDLSTPGDLSTEEKQTNEASDGLQISTMPATTALQKPSRCVLVAKCLTNSDASSGRIILPRVAVEANLPFVTAYRHYALTVQDVNGRRYEFVIKSWANGTEHRRVFVLEQASDFLRAHGIGVGDTVGICTDDDGELIVEANTEAVKQATISPRYGALALNAPPPGSAAAGALPLAAVMAGRCARSVHCTKPAGHPGFCSGPKAAAAAAAAAAAQAHAAGAAAAARFRRRNAAADFDSSNTQVSDAAVAGASLGNLLPASFNLPPSTGVVAEDYSSDGTATTAHHIYSTTLSHPRLPSNLHEVAYIPAGARLIKELTSYDLDSKRIILPAEDVEEEILNALDHDLLSLAAVDESQGWHFPTLRAWESVTGRRGYLLEGADAYVAARGAKAGDNLVVYRDTEHSPPRIEVRGGRQGTLIRRPDAPDGTVSFSDLPLLLLPAESNGSFAAHDPLPRARPPSGATSNVPLRMAGNGSMACQRTNGCTKPAGHQGFCSGHKGFKRKEGGTPTASSGRHGLRQQRWAQRSSKHYNEDDDSYWGASDDDEYTPNHKKQRRGPGSTPRSADDPLLSLLSLFTA